MKKNKRRLILSFLLLVSWLNLWITSFAFSNIHEETGNGIAAIPAVQQAIRCEGELGVSNYLLNVGETATIDLTETNVSDEFILWNTAHTTSATYNFDKIYRWIIVVDGQEFTKKTITCNFDDPGEYFVEGYLTARWKVNRESNTEEFPRYHYLTTKIQQQSICVTDLADVPKAVNPQGTKDKREEKTPTLHGSIYHTADWEFNRKDFNAYCNDAGKYQWIRDENTFWSGERFRLSAVVEGPDLPEVLTVHIEGTEYSTELKRNGVVYQGELFNEKMLQRWGQREKEELTFVFSASIDGKPCRDLQRITVDDVEKYWIMHRKEAQWIETRKL